MTLPPQLLNRVNKELKEKVDSLTAEVQRSASIIQLEKQVLQVTNQKLVSAQGQFTSVQRLVEDSTKKLQDAEHELTVNKREVERLKVDLQSRQGKSKDLLLRTESAENAVQETRTKYLLADQASKDQEQSILRWIEENKLTAAASAQATNILSAMEAKTKDMNRTTEMLRAQVQQVEEHYADEKQISDQLRSEINDAIKARQALELEKLDVSQQMLELHRREEDLANRKAAHASRVALLDEEKARKMAERELLIQSAKLLEDQQKATESSMKRIDVRKQHLASSAQNANVAVEDAELKHVLVEQECHIVAATHNKKLAELAQLRSRLEDITRRYEAAEARRAQLREQTAETEAKMGDATDEMQAQEAIVQQFQTELNVWIRAEERGRYALQQTLQSRQQDCQKTDDISVDLQRARKLLRATREKEAELQRRLDELNEVGDIMDTQVEAVALRIAEEEQKRGENSAALRDEKRRIIAELETELQDWQRQVRHTKAAVDAATNEFRQNTHHTEEMDAVLKSVQEEAKETQYQIAALQREHVELAAKRRDAQDAHEALYWRLQEMQRREAMAKDTLLNGLVEQEALRSESRLVEAQLAASKEGKLIELHAHEDDVSRMRRTLQSHKSQQVTLESRHKDIMRIIQNRMDKLHDETLADTVPEGGKLPLAPVVDEMSSEELQARQLVLRAAERDRYLQYGNSLDAQLVKIEKDLRTLDQGLELLRGSMQGDHRRLLTGAPMNEIEIEEEAILREIQESYLQEVEGHRAEVESEILSWEVECVSLDARLQEAKAQLRDAQKICLETLQRRDAVRSELRALERTHHDQLIDVDVGALGKQRALQLTRFLVDKQRNVQSNTTGLARLQAREDEEKLNAVIARLQHTVASKKHDEMYFAFRATCDRVGLSLDVLTKGAGIAPTAIQRTSSSSDRRPGTAALSGEKQTAGGHRAASAHGRANFVDPMGDRKKTQALRIAMQDLQLNPPSTTTATSRRTAYVPFAARK